MTSGEAFNATGRAPPRARSGLPVLIGGTLAALALAGTVAYAVAEFNMVHQHTSFIPLFRVAGLIAVPASAALLFLLFWLSNLLRRPVNGNILAGLVLASAVIAPAVVITLEMQMFARGQARLDAVFQALYGEAVDDIQAYDATLDDLHIPAMTSARALARGFSAGEAMNRLKAAREADAKLHAELDAKVLAARTRLQAVKVGARQKQGAIREFDLEFRHQGSGLKQLTGYQTYGLSMREEEVRFLSRTHWTTGSGWVSFSAQREADEWRQAEIYRTQADAHVRELVDFFRKNAAG